MEFINLSDYSTILILTILIAVACTVTGSVWIDYLYSKAPADLLSFPSQIAARAKYRKPLLFPLLVICIYKACLTVTSPALLYLITAVTFLCFVTVTDFEQYVIFDAMLLPLAVIGFLYTMHIGLPLKEYIIAALGGGLLFFILAVLTKGAIGGGDIKLIATMGLWLGIRPLLSVVTYGFIAGGLAALFLLITKQKSRHSYFAYGPYFTLSGIGILLGWFRTIF